MKKLNLMVAASALSLSGVAGAGAPTAMQVSFQAQIPKLTVTLPTAKETASVKDDDRKEAECHHLSDVIARERKAYGYYKNQIDKTCRAKAFSEWVGDYKKIQADYNKAIEGLNKALKALTDKLAGLKKTDPCTEQMDLLDCADAAGQLAASETKLQSHLAGIKAARAIVAAVRSKRLAAEKSDHYKDMEKCHELDLAGERRAAIINKLIAENSAKLKQCKADLAQIQHDNLEFRKQTAVKVFVQTLKCKMLNQKVKNGIEMSQKRDAALKAKKCLSDERVAALVKAMNEGLARRDAALRAMPGANKGATTAQLLEFEKAARAFVAYRERATKFGTELQQRADKCQAELAAMRLADAVLDGLLKNKLQDLRDCNISLAGLRIALAAANREIKD